MDAVTQLGITGDKGRPLDAHEITALATKVDPVDGKGAFSSRTAGMAFTLPFYEGFTLLVLRDPGWPKGMRAAYLAKDDRLHRLGGHSFPINDLNEDTPPRIDAETALPYLRFFCFFVHGADGPFLVCDRPDLPILPQDNIEAGVDAQIVPAELLGRDPRGRWIAAAVVHYDHALFAARFRIEPSGKVEMAEDAPLIENLPEAITAPLSFERDDDEIPY